MTDFKNMSEDELLLEVLKHKGTPSLPGITWREAFDEMSRRLREQERRISWLDEHSIMPGDWQTIVDLAIRAEQAEAELEQMTARCAEMSLREAQILLHFSPEHLDKVSGSDCGTKLNESLSNLPASVEKLLAIKKASEGWLDQWTIEVNEWNVGLGEFSDEDLALADAIRANREK